VTHCRGIGIAGRPTVAGLAAVAAFGLAAAVVVSACGPTPASPAASGQASAAASHRPGPPGLDWSAAAEVERPEGMSAEPPSVPPVTGGGLGHPGHFAGQGNPFDVAAVGDRLVAPGYTFPDFHAVTWSSTDRRQWSMADLSPGVGGAFALAIAAGRDGRSVIVGRIGNDAAAWSSSDGVAWRQADGGPAFVESPETRMTAVVATPVGFVAGGWAGITNQPARARFWGSSDGLSWVRLGDDPAFADGRVTSIVAAAGGLVAVGTTGPVGRSTGSAVWRSTDGRTWDRVTGSAALAAGSMTGVTAGGTGPAGGTGLVAVGASLDGTRALVWLSSDGLTWRLAPEQESLSYHGLKIGMSDVVAGPDGTLVAVGEFIPGTQYGQGTSWVSPDGSTWTRAEDLPVMGQGQPAAVIADGSGADGPGYVAVGTVGAPDNYIPTVWLSPADR
jgi:hypothetical protein